jgi:hypothetical protein
MSNIIQNILKTTIVGLFLDTYLKNHYPDEYDNFKIEVFYKCIYCFSKFQLYYFKMVSFTKYLKNKYNDIKQIMTNQSNLEKEKEKEKEKERGRSKDIRIIHFLNGNLHSKRYTEETDIQFEDTNNKSLFLFSQLEDNGIQNFAITRSQTFPSEYDISNVKFILVELNVGEKIYKIDLKNESENYYIVSNVLDKDFFLYYMFNHSHHYDEQIIFREFENQIENGIVKIIDENVKSLEVYFNKNGSITLEKNGYIINHFTSNSTNTPN